MPHLFDHGYFQEPFRILASDYPGADVYPPDQFRVEWGPIFHRGRLDGSARVLVIGQDPAQHETVVRRILVGKAGRRVEGWGRPSLLQFWWKRMSMAKPLKACQRCPI